MTFRNMDELFDWLYPCPPMMRGSTPEISPKRLSEQQQQEQVDADYERRDKLPKEPSYNSIADEIASYRPHPTARGE